MSHVATVTAEELSNGDWMVTAEGIDGRWVAAGDLSQAVGEATYACMIGEPPRTGTACVHEGAQMELYVPETGEYRIVGAREYVIGYARELRRLG